ncbi:MAG: hypothetical protein P4L65_07035 [Legionella sp.]|nr:hypothetical protein [Legionella sp.]
MNFKDWCMQQFGITDFREGKIPNYVFFPTIPAAPVKANRLGHGSYVINAPYLQGYVFPYDNYKILLHQLLLFFFGIRSINPKAYEPLLFDFFRYAGVNLAAQSEYKEPSPMHLIFNTEDNLYQFATIFSQLQPVLNTTTLIGTYTLQLPAFAVAHLQRAYYQQTNTEILNTESLAQMKRQLAELHKLKKIIIRPHLVAVLDAASILSRDYSNNQNGVSLLTHEAVSAYAVSLKSYAEINRDNLSIMDYLNLRTASSLLAFYDQNGSLGHSLKTDACFVHKLIANNVCPYRWGAKQETPFFIHLPEAVQKKISNLIVQNSTELLHGTSGADLRNKFHFKVKRFLPDESMNSEINEIILQGGGMSRHSAVFRIIKVGILANGTRASWQQKPLYYEYYKVVDNLGIGCNEMDTQSKTCLGTYVTRLRPCAWVDGQFIPIYIDPFQFPQKYQDVMEYTLRQLISTERCLLFYFSPGNAPGNCPEVHEWTRFHLMNQALSGQPHRGRVIYYGSHPINPSLPYERSVINQKNFYQEGGSCTIFSLKSLVFSLIGPSLGALHSNFMQLNNASALLAVMEHKISALQQRVMQQAAAKISNNRNLEYSRHAFFNPPEVGELNYSDLKRPQLN